MRNSAIGEGIAGNVGADHRSREHGVNLGALRPWLKDA